MRSISARLRGLLISVAVLTLGASLAAAEAAVAQTGTGCVSWTEFKAIKAGMSRWRIEHMADVTAWHHAGLVITYRACGGSGSKASVTYRIRTRADGSRHFIATGEKRLYVVVPTYSHTNRPAWGTSSAEEPDEQHRSQPDPRDRVGPARHDAQN